MVLTIEGIQDILADHESRISFLENSLPYNKNVISDVQETEQVPHIMSGVTWAAFDQLKGQVNYLTNKITEMRAARKPKSKYKYTKQSQKVVKSQ